MALSISHYFRPALLLGLDIGQTAIRMVELSQDAGRGYRLERRGWLTLPPGIVADRRIQHPARLAECIATLAGRLGSKRRHVALALPSDAVFTRRMHIPAHAGAAAIEELACAEAAAYLTLAPDQVQVDHQFSDTADAAQPEIVLAAARREQVEDRIAAVEAAGLHAAVVDIDLYAAHAACMRAVGAPRIDERAVSALLVCDAAQTQIALFDRRQLLYQRELPHGGEGFDMQQMEQIAAAAARALPLAIPAGMTLAHFFIGGDCPAPALARLSELLPGMTTSPTGPDRTSLLCNAPQPFAAMTIGGAANNAEEAEDADHPGAYLVACGLAMRRMPR